MAKKDRKLINACFVTKEVKQWYIIGILLKNHSRKNMYVSLHFRRSQRIDDWGFFNMKSVAFTTYPLAISTLPSAVIFLPFRFSINYTSIDSCGCRSSRQMLRRHLHYTHRGDETKWIFIRHDGMAIAPFVRPKRFQTSNVSNPGSIYMASKPNDYKNEWWKKLWKRCVRFNPSSTIK